MRILILVGLLFGLVACAPNARPTSQAMRAGDPMPTVRLVNLKGESVSLESYRSQPVLVNAWGTWCGPCREEMPMLVKLQEQYRKAGLKIIGINFGDSRAKLEAYLKTNPLGFETWLEGADTDSTRELLRRRAVQLHRWTRRARGRRDLRVRLERSGFGESRDSGVEVKCSRLFSESAARRTRLLNVHPGSRIEKSLNRMATTYPRVPSR
jgi:thiol-disulfide isomerase/thioredoxin